MTEEIPQVAADTAQGDRGKAPRTYLVWTLLAAALLFLPLGLVALALSLRTRALLRRGELERARRMSRATLAMTILTVVVGVLVYLVVIGGLLALGAFSGGG